MRLPKPRNLVAALLAAAGIVAAGLVIAQDQETLRVRSPLGSEDARFTIYLSRLLGHGLTSGNQVFVHTNGDAAFPAMLQAIARARHRISFETYIFQAGETAEQFVQAFEAAARRGVEVRMVLDSIGAEPIAPHLSRLEDAGCEIGWFNPVASYSLEEANYRTHRKALVIDGETAFVGGIGIADQWARDVEQERMWRDTQIELRGAVALDVEAAFNENWIETGGVVAPDLLPHDRPAPGAAQSITVWSSPEGGANAIKLLYLLSIGAARRTLDIQSPYFITDESSLWSLLDARRRHVRIRLLVEGDVTDAKPVKFASRAQYERLLAAGIEIYEYQPAMMHTKAMMVDGVLGVIGSANFDNRSFELNDELNVAVFDRALTSRLTADFERDITRAQRLRLETWRDRPFHIRAREKAWSFFGEVF
jgi:cardiolipin synthase A/B